MAVIAVLAVSGPIVRHAKQPASHIFLRTARSQVPVQREKSILYHVLRLVARKPQANQVSKQGLAQFAIQGGRLARAAGQVERGKAKFAASPLMKSSSSRFYRNNK